MQFLKRLKPMVLPQQNSTANTIYVDSDTEEVKVGSGASGSTERSVLTTGSETNSLGPRFVALGLNADSGITGSLSLNGGSGTAVIVSDAADTLALRNGTNAQTFRIYNTYTDASNYERLLIGAGVFGANTFGMVSTEAGTGTGRGMYVGTGTPHALELVTDNTSRFYINSSGHFLANADNTYDIGASGATRPRTIYVGTQINAPRFYLSAGATGSVLLSPSDGTAVFANNAETGFTRLILGTNDANGVALVKGSGIIELTTGDGASGYTRAKASQFLATEFVHTGITAGITASTTQTQGQGALTTQINEVSVCANANDTVTLPAAVAGREVTIINNGAQTLRIYPASGDNAGAGVDTAVTLATATNRTYVAFDATNWEII